MAEDKLIEEITMNLDTDFDYNTLDLAEDYEGKPVACLISAKANQGGRAAVLYLHGFVDYFFHPHVAAQFLQHDIDFYALDLRRYGRALLPGQHPNYCRDVAEYYEEIDLAIEQISQHTGQAIYLLGHSTGGLIASLYVSEGRQRQKIKALILNSPFFRFNLPPLLRTILPALSALVGYIAPYANTPGVLPPVYPQSLHKDYYGEWDFNLDWKPIDGFPAYFRWLHAISRAHKKVEKGLNLDLPIRVLHSSASSLIKEYGPLARDTDIVLNVEDIKQLGATLGPQVSLQEVQGAVHDVFLSAPDVREQAFADMFTWLAEIKA